MTKLNQPHSRGVDSDCTRLYRERVKAGAIVVMDETSGIGLGFAGTSAADGGRI